LNNKEKCSLAYIDLWHSTFIPGACLAIIKTPKFFKSVCYTGWVLLTVSKHTVYVMYIKMVWGKQQIFCG